MRLCVSPGRISADDVTAASATLACVADAESGRTVRISENHPDSHPESWIPASTCRNRKFFHDALRPLESSRKRASIHRRQASFLRRFQRARAATGRPAATLPAALPDAAQPCRASVSGPTNGWRRQPLPPLVQLPPDVVQVDLLRSSRRGRLDLAHAGRQFSRFIARPTHRG